MLETTLQKNIKDRLEQKNISIAELERRAGLRHAVINILHGRSKNPSIHTAQAIAKELDCSIEDLLSEKKDISKELYDNLIEITTQKINNPAPAIPSPISENKHTSLEWDPLLAKKALDTINNYLVAENITADSTEIFLCINEIYKYALNNKNKNIDPAFVSWVTDRFFVRHLH